MAALLNLEQFYYTVLKLELNINQWVQERLAFAEPVWFGLSKYFETSNVMDIFVPLAGVFRQELLLRLVCALSVVNTLNSWLKWVYPETRPYWFLREMYASGRHNNTNALAQYRLSCDTSGGMPCTHTMSFTVFVFIVSSYLFPYCYNAFKLPRTKMWRSLIFGFITFCVGLMWLSRLYLASEFLHQCMLGTYLAVQLLFIFERNVIFLYSRQRQTAVLTVLAFGLMPLLIYFGKLHMDRDPHWSVRQAFNWCPETSYLRHESSPIFMLARDFGSLMGVALSSPLIKWNVSNTNLSYRFFVMFGLEIVNFLVRHETPKHYGRFVFLAYEFTRNLLHSLALLKFISKLK